MSNLDLKKKTDTVTLEYHFWIQINQTGIGRGETTLSAKQGDHMSSRHRIIHNILLKNLGRAGVWSQAFWHVTETCAKMEIHHFLLILP